MPEVGVEFLSSLEKVENIPEKVVFIDRTIITLPILKMERIESIAEVSDPIRSLDRDHEISDCLGDEVGSK